MVNTWFDTLAWIKANPDEAIEIMAKRAGVSAEDYRTYDAGTTIFTTAAEPRRVHARHHARAPRLPGQPDRRLPGEHRPGRRRARRWTGCSTTGSSRRCRSEPLAVQRRRGRGHDASTGDGPLRASGVAAAATPSRPWSRRGRCSPSARPIPPGRTVDADDPVAGRPAAGLGRAERERRGVGQLPAVAAGGAGRPECEMARSGELLADSWATAQRVLLGFGLAVLVSVPLGIAMGTFHAGAGGVRADDRAAALPAGERVHPAADHLARARRAVQDRAALHRHGLLQHADDRGRGAPRAALDSSTCPTPWAPDRGEVLRKVIVPHSLPGMIDAIRVNAAAAWNFVVVAELVNATAGLGYRIVRAQRFLQTDKIFAVLVVIGVVGVDDRHRAAAAARPGRAVGRDDRRAGTARRDQGLPRPGPRRAGARRRRPAAVARRVRLRGRRQRLRQVDAAVAWSPG